MELSNNTAQVNELNMMWNWHWKCIFATFPRGVAITIHKEKYGIFSQLYKRVLSSLSMYGAKSKFFMLKKETEMIK